MKNYLSLVKFSHTVFALPFAMIGFTLGVLSKAGIWCNKIRSDY
jgi:4-hydroxybenzoate polyprenyltransferase